MAVVAVEAPVVVEEEEDAGEIGGVARGSAAALLAADTPAAALLAAAISDMRLAIFSSPLLMSACNSFIFSSRRPTVVFSDTKTASLSSSSSGVEVEVVCEPRKADILEEDDDEESRGEKVPWRNNTTPTRAKNASKTIEPP